MAIGDTRAGVLAAVLTAAVLTVAALTVAPAARTAAVAGVCAAIGVVTAGAMSVYTELAGCAGSELLTTDAGDAVRADEPVCAVREEPRSAAAPRTGAISGPGVELCPLAEFSVPVGNLTRVLVAGPPISVAFAFAPPELLTDDDGPDCLP